MRPTSVLAVVAAVSLAAASPAGAVSVGRFGGAQGCGCHGLSPTAATEILVEADGGVAAGSETTLVVRIADTPIPAHAENAHGGFDLVVAEGELTTLDPDAVRAEGREAGHRRLGNRQREWRVRWRVPETPRACAIAVRAAVLAANGDASTTYDEWNLATIEIPVATDDDGEPPELAFVSPPTPAIMLGPLDLSVPAPLSIHVGAPVEIGIRAADPSGIATVTLRDEDALGAASLPNPAFDPESGLFVFRWDTTHEPPGLHRLTATAADCAGNEPGRAVLEILVLL